VILGKSNIVGLPLSLIMMNELATVTVCNEETNNLKYYTKMADILISACSKPLKHKV
jgi:methylenetetrahydrofolate dehydrogenase (NADP+)/methenyltetrahydrofolate cyclohydrolase